MFLSSVPRSATAKTRVIGRSVSICYFCALGRVSVRHKKVNYESQGNLSDGSFSPRPERLSRHRVWSVPLETYWRAEMSVGTILLIVLVLLLIGALPAWPYSASWGPYPAGGLGLLVVIVLVLVLLGRV
jgi:hypothetical protein